MSNCNCIRSNHGVDEDGWRQHLCRWFPRLSARTKSRCPHKHKKWSTSRWFLCTKILVTFLLILQLFVLFFLQKCAQKRFSLETNCMHSILFFALHSQIICQNIHQLKHLHFRVDLLSSIFTPMLCMWLKVVVIDPN